MQTQEVRYGEDPLQGADVCGEGDEEYMLLFLHGGLWVNGDKGEYAALATSLRREGWAVCVANYRLTSKDATVMAPTHTEDAKQCLAHLVQLVKPRRYVLVGHSCGAHMAALIVQDASLLRACGGPPAAVVAVQGLFSIAAFCRDFPQWRGEVERSQGSDEAAWIDPSGGGETEWVLIHSPEDPWVNEEQSRLWLRQLPPGTRARLVTDISGVHYAAVRDDPKGEAGQRVVREIVAVMAAAEEPLAQRDERRRLQAAGYREGRAKGTEEAAQGEFNRGFSQGAAEAQPAGRALGLLHTREQLGGAEDPRKDALIHRLEEGEMSAEELARIMQQATL
jgi:predicted alpha/beta hydrolase family esterase